MFLSFLNVNFISPLINRESRLSTYVNNIFLYNIQEETITTIGEDFEKSGRPNIQSNAVVWSYRENSHWNIKVYNIETETITKTIETNIQPESWRPYLSIYEETLVFRDRMIDSGVEEWKLVIYNLITDERTILNTVSVPITFIVHKNKIIIILNEQIWLYDINTKIITQLTQEAHAQDVIVANENHILWIDTRNTHLNHDIYIYDFDQQEVKPFAEEIDYNEREPNIQGTEVIYTKNSTSGTGNKYIAMKII